MKQKNDINEKEYIRLQHMLIYEKQAYQQGYQIIAGIDEAGRGPLAGPVVAAACLLPKDFLIPKVNDSKKLTPKVRAELFEYLIHEPTIKYGIGIIEAEEIDEINIYQATIKAMWQAVEKLDIQPDYVLVDGMPLSHAQIKCQKIIKGDQLSLSIAAASIIAKETRDQIMCQYHLQWPEYGFEKNKGYGTSIHLKALEDKGPCRIHRFSFDPIKTNKLSLKDDLSFQI